LMGLPSHQTCIDKGAYFRFHAPSAQSQRSVRIAQMYMMRKYPGWVRSWISRNNGLSHQLITMNYSYASKFMKRCSAVASR
jgi:pterin-4a-carbinolamine dehydratase